MNETFCFIPSGNARDMMTSRGEGGGRTVASIDFLGVDFRCLVVAARETQGIPDSPLLIRGGNCQTVLCAWMSTENCSERRAKRISCLKYVIKPRFSTGLQTRYYVP